MAGSQKSFSWNADTLVRNLHNLPAAMYRMIVAAVEYHATRGEALMRKGAKWTDRTSNARNSLHTATFHENTMGGSRHTIIFAHGMAYGIWLEVRFAGRYAIIMPSVLTEGGNLMKTLDKGMARVK